MVYTYGPRTEARELIDEKGEDSLYAYAVSYTHLDVYKRQELRVYRDASNYRAISNQHTSGVPGRQLLPLFPNDLFSPSISTPPVLLHFQKER